MDTLTLHWLDGAIVAGYLAASLGLGIAMRRQGSRDEFLVAGRSMGRITVGLSVMATLFSANSFVMYPSTAYGNSLRIFMAVVAFWAMGPVVAWVFIPVYSRLDCQTAYEYLEKRFHVAVRCLASALFVMLRISWMAAATFAASVAISAMAGLNQYLVIWGLGAVAIVYTMLGGLRAVMWTDVLQFFVFFGTILFAVLVLVEQTDGGIPQMVATYFEGRDHLLFDFGLDPALQFGTVAIVMGSFLEALSAFGADQVAVQRYIAARDARTSQTGLLISLLGLLVVIPGLLLIGVGLFSYFKQYPRDLAPVVARHLATSDDERADAVRRQLQQHAARAEGPRVEATGSAPLAAVESYYARHPDRLHADVVQLGLNDQAMPRFVQLRFPPGVLGLLVAALMAATMSSIDSGIHSVTTALLIDFRDRLFPAWRPATDAGEMRVARVLVVAIGVSAITLACFVGQLGDVFAVAKKTVGAFAAPLLAVFILGLFVPRATSLGVFFGTWIGAAATLWLMFRYDHWFSMWFFPIGFFSAVGLAMLFSLIGRPGQKPPAETLTYWNVLRRHAAAPAGDEDARSRPS